MKKLINRPEDVVAESLSGLALAFPELVRYDHERGVIARAAGPIAGKVGLVSGGGSGHEPMHAGYVGSGMLDAAAPGAVFTSPGPEQILAATQAADGGAGILHVVKNYTGDVMNFRLAAELAGDLGIDVQSVLVDDDAAVEDSLYTAGRRGTGATVLVEKIAGAHAAAGASLSAVAATAALVNDRSRSLGIALTSCTTPAAGRPTFEIDDDELEFGVGIHGEPGRRREKVRRADTLVAEMVQAIVDDLGLGAEATVLAFVNGLGATPLQELLIVFGALHRELTERRISVVRSLVGNFVTSLDMAGASITLLELDDDLAALWDAPVWTPALRWGV